MPSLTVRFEAVSRWWHQKSPYLLCSSGLALAGTWTLQNVWGFTRSCSRQNGWEWPFYDSMMLLALACLSYVWQPVGKCPLWLCGLRLWAVDDTKNHLTYFVRVDWHLPGRELSKMSEVSQVMLQPDWLRMAVLRFHDVACVGMSVICLAACW